MMRHYNGVVVRASLNRSNWVSVLSISLLFL